MKYKYRDVADVKTETIITSINLIVNDKQNK